MAHLYTKGGPLTLYADKNYKGGKQAVMKSLLESTTLYVGNLANVTREEQVYEVFSKCGEIQRIIMEYCDRESAADAVAALDGSRLDDRTIRVDWDAGFQEGRQFGRGKYGGQVRDDYRDIHDPGRMGGAKEGKRQREGDTGAPGAGGGGPPMDTFSAQAHKRSRTFDSGSGSGSGAGMPGYKY